MRSGGFSRSLTAMAEHSLRYESFAKYLVAKGFVVCVNDHAGHGKSAVVRRALVILVREAIRIW